MTFCLLGHSKCVSLLIVHGANLDASDCHVIRFS